MLSGHITAHHTATQSVTVNMEPSINKCLVITTEMETVEATGTQKVRICICRDI